MRSKFKQKAKLFSGIFMVLIVLFYSQFNVFADEKNQSNIPFSVKPLFENQNQIPSGYFDLKTNPNQTEKLEFLIQNHTNEDLEIDVEPGYPISSNNRDISYISFDENNLSANKNSTLVAQNIKIINKIKLSANETKKIDFQVKSPDEEIGVYIGALIFTGTRGEIKNIESNIEDSSFSAENRFQFRLGIKLNMPKSDDANFLFGDKVIVVSNGNELNVDFPVQNDSKMIYQNGLKYEILSKKGNKIFDGSFFFKMAPSTKTMYSIPWNGNIENGDYKLIVSTENGKISKSYNFSVSNNDLLLLSEDKSNINVKASTTPEWVKLFVIGSSIIFVLLIAVIILMVRKNRSTKNVRNASNESA